MVSIGEQLLRQGFSALLNISGRKLVCPSGQFTALLNTVSQVSPDEQLGADQREFIVAAFLRTQDPDMSYGDAITESLEDGTSRTYRVRAKEDAPGEPAVKYTLEKIE